MTDLPSRKELSSVVQKAAQDEGITERRLRRWVAVGALIEVFNIARSRGQLPTFLVKGGFALELRFRSLARSSRDVDVVLGTEKPDLVDAVIEAIRTPWSGFTFRIKGAVQEREHSYRISVNALYLSADWSTFEVELVVGDVDRADMLQPYGIDAFGLMRPSEVPCLNASEQIAQKLHAVTDPAEDRPRDLVDIFLLDSQLDHDDDTLRTAVEAIFQKRGTHTWPPSIELRDGWRRAIEELLRRNEIDLAVEHIVDGVHALVLRLLGVSLKMNYRYHFLVLSALDHVPNALESAIAVDEGQRTLQRMTENEGWRLAHLLDYPSRDRTRAMLAVLEKPGEGAQSAVGSG